MSTNEEEFIGRIRDAFHDVKLGEGASLNMTEFYDSWETEPEFVEKAKFDEKDDWATIPDKTLESFASTFSFTDVAGFRFYLPAYMIWTLKNHLVSDSIIGDFTIYALDVDHCVFEDVGFINAFTADQLSCIQDFLTFCIKNDGSCDGRVAKKNLDKLKEKQGEH